MKRQFTQTVATSANVYKLVLNGAVPDIYSGNGETTGLQLRDVTSQSSRHCSTLCYR